MALESQSTTLAIEGSPDTYTIVGEVTALNGPSGQASVIDVSHLGSTRREKLMGLPDEGQVTVSMFLDPDDAGQLAMKTARSNRTLATFRIMMSDGASPGTTLTFSGYVLSFSQSFAVDQAVTAEATIEITGEVVTA